MFPKIICFDCIIDGRSSFYFFKNIIINVLNTNLKSSDIKISEVCKSVGLNDKIMQALIDEGVETYDQIEDMSDEEIVALPGIGKATLKKLRDFKY